MTKPALNLSIQVKVPPWLVGATALSSIRTLPGKPAADVRRDFRLTPHRVVPLICPLPPPAEQPPYGGAEPGEQAAAVQDVVFPQRYRRLAGAEYSDGGPLRILHPDLL